jgi:hypothetical protein
MAGSTVRIAAVIVAMIAVAGCDAGTAPPGTPGSINVSLHGRVETGIGASSR